MAEEEMIIRKHRGPRRSRGSFFLFWIRKGSSLFAAGCIFVLVVFSLRSNPSSTDLKHFEQDLRTQKGVTTTTLNFDGATADAPARERTSITSAPTSPPTSPPTLPPTTKATLPPTTKATTKGTAEGTVEGTTKATTKGTEEGTTKASNDASTGAATAETTAEETIDEAPPVAETTTGAGREKFDPASATEPIDTANKRFRLFQVINTFATHKDRADDKDLVHQPYDQWSTLLSIRRAKQNLPSNLEVTLICAMFESDVRVLKTELNNTCDQIVTLTRSTRTEYGLSNLTLNATTTENNAPVIPQEEVQFAEVFHAREFPFIQDLINSAVEAGRTTVTQQSDENDDGDTDFYVMLTNSDIGLTKNFYSTLVNLLEKGAKAYTINRWSIPMEGENHPITIREATTDVDEANKLLSQIDVALETGKTHPGYDCFIMHSSIVGKVQLGNMYAAYPPWGSALFRILRDIVARGHYHKTQSSPNGTFHLGDQGTWSKQKTDPKRLAVLEYVKKNYKADIHDCPKPILTGDPYTHLNAANCGKVFREVYNRTQPPIEEQRARQRQRQRRRAKQERQRRAKRQG